MGWYQVPRPCTVIYCQGDVADAMKNTYVLSSHRFEE